MRDDLKTVRRSLMQQADGIVRSATAYLTNHFGADFQECVSVGVIGSYARGALCAVSDIDYYVVFDAVAFEGRGIDLSDAAMSAVVEQTIHHVQRTYPEQALTRRFSVYWTTLQCLENGTYDVGRWTPYDREVFRRQGEHLAGKVIAREIVPPVRRSAIVSDSAQFLVDVVRSKLESVKIFQDLDRVGASALGALGDVVLVKVVLMPARLLYVLLPVQDERLIVDTEAAVAGCAEFHCSHPWWALIDSALQWRESPPIDSAGLEHAAMLLRRHLTELYVFCLGRFADALRAQNESSLAARLDGWRKELEDTHRSQRGLDNP